MLPAALGRQCVVPSGRRLSFTTGSWHQNKASSFTNRQPQDFHPAWWRCPPPLTFHIKLFRCYREPVYEREQARQRRVSGSDCLRQYGLLTFTRIVLGGETTVGIVGPSSGDPRQLYARVGCCLQLNACRADQIRYRRPRASLRLRTRIADSIVGKEEISHVDC